MDVRRTLSVVVVVVEGGGVRVRGLTTKRIKKFQPSEKDLQL
jgi:hypothetical protein